MWLTSDSYDVTFHAIWNGPPYGLYRRRPSRGCISCGNSGNLPKELLVFFYTAMIHSVLCTSITLWFGSATKQYRARFQRSIWSAERITSADLPSIHDMHRSWVRKRVENISADLSHPGHRLYKLQALQSAVYSNQPAKRHFIPPVCHSVEHCKIIHCCII